MINPFKIIATDAGLMAIGEKTVTLETGKSFYIGTYQRSEDEYQSLRYQFGTLK